LGGFYGSVQLRSDRDRVKAAAEQVVRARKIRCLVGPAINGWVGVYPEQNGQDQTIGEEIARITGGEAIHLVVHDDSIFAYWFWRDGVLVDSYWSRPGYFFNRGKAAQEAMAGRPELFGPMIGERVEKLRQLLRRDGEGFTFEVERLEQFANLLGISNSTTSYEYLKYGETDEIQNWKQFIDLPEDEIRAEKAAAAQRRKEITAQKSKLKADGFLLYEEVRKGTIARACRAGAGFVVAWHGAGKSDKGLVQWHRSPWRSVITIPLEIGQSVNAVTSNLLANETIIAFDGKAELLEFSDEVSPGRLIPNVGWTPYASLSNDGQFLVHSDNEGAHVTATENGAMLATLRAGDIRTGATLHPSNRWLVVPQRGICLMEVPSVTGYRELSADEKSRLRRTFASIKTRATEKVDVVEMEKQMRESMESAIEKTLKEANHPPSHGQIKILRATLENEVADRLRPLFEAKAGRFELSIEGNETPLCIHFSRHGQRMWCGTNRGLRGYLWNDVLAARSDEMPAPRWRFNAEASTSTGYIYAIQEESNGAGVIFAGYDGKMRRMDLPSGSVREILSVPDGGAIIDVCLSSDQSTVGIVTRPAMHEKAAMRNERCIWQVWSYSNLIVAS
jgi:hypothetical protein